MLIVKRLFNIIIMNYYIAKLFIRHCRADIRINDVALFKQEVDADLTLEMPINYLIESSGSQLLTANIYPISRELSFSAGTKCSIEIWRYDGSGFKIIPLEQICSSTLSVNEMEQTLPLKFDKQLFFSDVSYKITRWSDCKEIKDRPNLASEVIAYFQNIGQLLANRQYEKYNEYVRDREGNVSTALSLDDDEANSRNQMLFKCLSSGFSLLPIKDEKKLQFYANERLVTILEEDMRSALRFQNVETGEILAIELLLGIKKGHNSLTVI